MEELINVLQKEQNTLNALIGATKQEQEAIVNKNMELLQMSIKEKERLEKQLQALEEERIRLTGNKDFTTLLQAASDKAEILQALRQSLKKSLLELKHLQTTNTILLKTELAYFNVLKELLNANSPHYDAQGKLSKTSSEPNTMITHRA
ncbi:MAG: flagellar protein FlgN [Firmicutes bacterium]|nr:flagellar protein FlgN [Bacillota bacterium]